MTQAYIYNSSTVPPSDGQLSLVTGDLRGPEKPDEVALRAGYSHTWAWSTTPPPTHTHRGGTQNWRAASIFWLQFGEKLYIQYAYISEIQRKNTWHHAYYVLGIWLISDGEGAHSFGQTLKGEGVPRFKTCNCPPPFIICGWFLLHWTSLSFWFLILFTRFP